MKKVFTAHIDPKLHHKLKVYVAEHDTTVQKVIERLIRELPEKEDKVNESTTTKH